MLLLRLGMRIALTASIRGVAELEVTALLPHGVVLHRIDAGARAEAFMVLAPERDPAHEIGRQASVSPRAAGLPLLFHRDGGFWQRDPATGQDTPLAPGVAVERLRGFGQQLRFAAQAYPEIAGNERAQLPRTGERRRVQPAWLDA